MYASPTALLKNAPTCRQASASMPDRLTLISGVTPVKTGVQSIRKVLKALDSGFRRNDAKMKINWVPAGVDPDENRGRNDVKKK
jgi:hypothetical protein